MATQTLNQDFVAGTFDTVADADRMVRTLLAAGFSKDRLAVICPEKFKHQLTVDVPEETPAATKGVEGIAVGGAAGVVLGGIALAATTIASGGIGLIPAATVFLGGGAIAGGFSGLIIADGYGKDVDQYYNDAVHLGKIVVGVRVQSTDNPAQIARAHQLLEDGGAQFPPS